MHKMLTILVWFIGALHFLPFAHSTELLLKLDKHTARISTTSNGIQTTFSTPLGKVLNAHHGLTFKNVPICFQKSALQVLCNWETGTQLKIEHAKISELTCTHFNWEATDYADVLTDCFDLDDAQWYGGGETYTQAWPMQNDSREESPYVLNDVLQNPEHFYGGVLEKLWITSKGVTIRVEEEAALFVSLNQNNDKQLCLISKNQRPYVNTKHLPPRLNYTVCNGKDLLTAYKEASKLYLKKPTAAPDEKMLTYPFWNTWAKYKAKINASVVLDFAQTVNKYGFPKSLFQIDDKWESCYGQLEFSKETFPDAKALISEMNSLGFRVNVWVHPFINNDCPAFAEAEKQGYFVKLVNGDTAIAKWWNGNHAGIIDVTNPSAINWWKKRLQRVKDDYGVNAFKFDAGETNWLPSNVTFFDAPEHLIPNVYSTKYGQFVEQFGKTVEVRQRYRNQDSSIFIRLLDRESTWGNSMGLQTIIPATLVFGLLGYPYVLADMIGGNAYSGFPSKELYIRWMEANTLLPVMQFSVSPWQYDDEVVAIARKMIQLHEDHSQLFIELAKEATSTGWPIIRPLWWVAPNELAAQVARSQFLVGDDVIVAPVLEDGARSRDIYLPSGTWYDNLNNETYDGPIWLYNYQVEIDELAYFTARS